MTLRNQFIANNSQINIRSIGQLSNNPNGVLRCFTGLPGFGYGEWYLPNATMIGRYTSVTMYYTNRGDNGEIILSRPHNVTSPTGRFCCEVFDENDIIIDTLCVIIGKP